MTLRQLPDDAPATSMFPQFQTEIYDMYSTEVEGLTDQQLDFESDRWEWAKWSIRRNVSHVGSGDFRWLLLRWGEVLFTDGLPQIDDPEGVLRAPQDRRLDESRYWKMEDILGKMREGLDLCVSVLSKETVGSLRTREIKNPVSEQFHLFSLAHPRGIRPDPDDSSQVYIALEYTFRHRYYEYLTHLFNIQRIKRAQGLTARVELPREGYWMVSGWDTSEA